ncbi:YeeE/YedE family protein [Litorivita pollutaquae]|uniref:YeeE/YedE family protein n=1 Tax=Litorivita pollutaquae TaxID=2200892 RepID=A0A2V4MW71_9RHOB|nr:YeeE/YedE family protein [Litorivita pollutaquae]PYC48558.1 YeeE/YedE family protein [Litorivita pollutaquae]
MFESFGFETLTAPQAAVYFALLIGAAFGALAQITRFCFRRAVMGTDRREAAGVWFAALAIAALGTQWAVAADLISFGDHRFMATDLPYAAIILGGLAFGIGMVLTRGCVSRLTVLGASGNLRAALVIVVFAVVAHATLKGVLAPVRTTLGAITLPLENAALPGNGMLWAAIIAVIGAGLALRARLSLRLLVPALLLGALVPLAWVGTGYVLYDDFDPIAMESLSFTSPAAETLFWVLASTSIPAGFGTGLLGGVILGALVAALLRGEFTWQSFESPAQTGRYMAGAALMGVGGVLAGGCTVGAGLSGVPTLSVAALLAIASVAAGGYLAARGLNEGAFARAAASPARQPQPAE